MGDHYAGARGYCDHFTHAGYGQPKGECPSCTPDLSRPIAEPGAIRVEAMTDSRRLRWHKVGEMGYVVGLGTTYIGACHDKEAGVWMLGRVRFCDECGHFEVAQDDWHVNRRDHSPARITHFADDVLGTPYDAPSGQGLRS